MRDYENLVCDNCLTAMYDNLESTGDDDADHAAQVNLAITAGEIIDHLGPRSEMQCEEIEFYNDEDLREMSAPCC